MPQPPPRPELLLTGVLLAGLLVRLPFLATDFRVSSDIDTYQRWARAITRDGLTAIYDGTDVVYLPLLLAFFGAASLVHLHAPAWLQTLGLVPLIKLPAMLGDLAGAGLIAWVLRDRTPTTCVVACTAYLFHPVTWYVSSYWGQLDSVYTALLLASTIALTQGAVLPAWAMYGLGLATKPQSLAVAPALVAASLARHGRHRLAGGLAVSLVVGIVIAAPWILAGKPAAPLRPYTTQIEAPRVDVSAYNVWYLLRWGRVHMVSSAERPRGLPFSYRQIGTGAFGTFALLVSWLVWRGGGHRLPLAGAVLSLAMFVLLTQVYERHMFAALPLLILAAAGYGEPRPGLPCPRLWGAWGVLSVTLLFNVVTVASFAPTLWTNLIAPQPDSPLIACLRALALVSAGVNVLILVALTVALARPPIR